MLVHANAHSLLSARIGTPSRSDATTVVRNKIYRICEVILTTLGPARSESPCEPQFNV
jgi:hypothetical protein